MSRGYDGPEIDDFRDSGFRRGRDADRGQSSAWNSRLALHNIHREDDRADGLGLLYVQAKSKDGSHHRKEKISDSSISRVMFQSRFRLDQVASSNTLSSEVG